MLGAVSWGYEKQGDSKLIKAYSNWAIFKAVGRVEFEFGAGRLWANSLASSEEVNDRDQYAEPISPLTERSWRKPSVLWDLYEYRWFSTDGERQEVLLGPWPCSDFVRSCMWIW